MGATGGSDPGSAPAHSRRRRSSSDRYWPISVWLKRVSPFFFPGADFSTARRGVCPQGQGLFTLRGGSRRGDWPYNPALNCVNTRVCTRRMAGGSASGVFMRARSSGLRKIEGLAATSGFTKGSEALFGLA